jgi:hypothetical protein
VGSNQGGRYQYYVVLDNHLQQLWSDGRKCVLCYRIFGALPNDEFSRSEESTYGVYSIRRVHRCRCQSKAINSHREMQSRAWINNDRKGWKRTSVLSIIRSVSYGEVNEGIRMVRQDWHMQYSVVLSTARTERESNHVI